MIALSLLMMVFSGNAGTNSDLNSDPSDTVATWQPRREAPMPAPMSIATTIGLK